MKPLAISSSLSLPPLTNAARVPPRVETAVTSHTELEPTPTCANKISARISPRKESQNVLSSAKTVIPALLDPTPEHDACTAFQTVGNSTPLMESTIKPLDAPSVPPRPNPKPTKPKITSFYKCKPPVPHVPLKPITLQNTKKTIKMPEPVPHHPSQVSSEAVKVFSFKSQSSPSPKPTSKLVQPKPITCFTSYKAYEAACASPIQAKPCPLETPPMWLGEHLQHSVSGFHDRSEPEQTWPDGMPTPDADAWSNFIAARLPTFTQSTSRQAANPPGLVDIFDSASEGPAIGSLFDLPSPVAAPAIPTVVKKWAEEKKKKKQNKTGCILYRNKPLPTLEDPGFDLAAFLDLGNEEDTEEQAMTDLCAAMDSLGLEKEQQNINQPTLDEAFGSYGFEYAETDHTASNHQDNLFDAPIFIDHEEAWEGDEWTMLTPPFTSSDGSDFEPSSEFDFASDDCDLDISPTDLHTRDINSALKEALHIPLPSSTSTENLVREDNDHVMKILSEQHEGFVELVGMEWGLEDDEFSVSLEAWNDDRFKGGKEQNPFETFPILDGEAMGEEGMVL